MFNKTIVLALMTLVFFSAQAQKKSVPAQNTEEQKAMATIKYVNAAITLYNGYTEALESHANNLKVDIDPNLARLKSKSSLSPFRAGECDFSSLPPDEEKSLRAALPKIPDIPEKTTLQQLNTQALYWYDKTKTLCSAIGDYFIKEDYNNDAGLAKGTALRDSMSYSIKQAYKYWGLVAQTASDAGNKAELVLLKKSKIASFVIPMKQSLMELNNVMRSLQNDTADINTINEKLKEATANIAQRAGVKMDYSKLSVASYQDTYESFYYHCQDCIRLLQGVVDDIKAAKDKENIRSAYGYANTSYNAAVDDYNTFIRQ